MAYTYKVMGKEVTLDVDPAVVAVRFDPLIPRSMRAQATEDAGAGPFSSRFEIPGEALTIVPVGYVTSDPDKATKTITRLNVQPEVEQTLPVFRVGGNRVVAADRVIVGIKDPVDIPAIEAKYALSLVEARDNSAVYQIPAKTDVFELCATLDHDSMVRFAEPDFITIGKHIPSKSSSTTPSVALPQAAEKQYAMNITQARAAWEVQLGLLSITIAILDEGVDTKHKDLAGAISKTFDGTDNDPYQEPNSWDGHGTACAGLAGGAGKESDNGVLGSGTGCSIMPIRIAYSGHEGGPWVTSNSIISRSIKWAWENGADVLSNSWGGGAPSNEIAEHFENARTKGRGGLGCVIVVAAGNSNGPVQFPGTVPNILTVSASNEFDQLKTPTSADGENWWGTCFGPEISVAAPGVHNRTTDIGGVAGYTDGDYSPNFNGTSSATPIVAGACGLVLSCNRNFQEEQVREIIIRSADKVGAYEYVDGRNDYFGYGRLNVLNAVNIASGAATA